MSSEYPENQKQPTDPQSEHSPPAFEQWGQRWTTKEEDTQPRPVVKPSSSPASPAAATEQEAQNLASADFTYREHITGSLPAAPWAPPQFPPAYPPPPLPAPAQSGRPNAASPNPPMPAPAFSQNAPPYAYYPQYQAQRPPYPGYAPAYPAAPMPYPPAYGAYAPYPAYNGRSAYPSYPYPYAWAPPQPKRDGYQLALAVISLIGSCLAFLGGIIAAVVLLLYIIGSARVQLSTISPGQNLSTLLTFTALAFAGVIGGAFSFYHSIRALLKKGSALFKLPPFWIFAILYLIVLAIGLWLHANDQEVTVPVLTISLIALAAIFPALTLLALGDRRLRFPAWPTTWRRFVLALTSGATLAIGLGLLLEFVLLLLLLGRQTGSFSSCIDDPNGPNCQGLITFNLIFVVVAVMGPLVEETVKPLAVALYIGRVRSAAEAFVLGMACGIGFDLVETVGYIGSGYHDWLTVAIERTGAGLLHGFGAAMVAVGWYYLTHAKKQRVLKAFGFWAYAVFQHFVWNGTLVLPLLPPPLGALLNSWNVNLGFTTLSFFEIANIIEAILILVFFIYMTGRLRKQIPPPAPSSPTHSGNFLATPGPGRVPA